MSVPLTVWAHDSLRHAVKVQLAVWFLGGGLGFGHIMQGESIGSNMAD